VATHCHHVIVESQLRVHVNNNEACVHVNDHLNNNNQDIYNTSHHFWSSYKEAHEVDTIDHLDKSLIASENLDYNKWYV